MLVISRQLIDGITDKGSLPKMRIWSILSIISDLKWCIHISRSLFLYLSKNRCRHFPDIHRMSANGRTHVGVTLLIDPMEK